MTSNVTTVAWIQTTAQIAEGIEDNKQFQHQFVIADQISLMMEFLKIVHTVLQIVVIVLNHLQIVLHVFQNFFYLITHVYVNNQITIYFSACRSNCLQC